MRWEMGRDGCAFSRIGRAGVWRASRDIRKCGVGARAWRRGNMLTQHNTATLFFLHNYQAHVEYSQTD